MEAGLQLEKFSGQFYQVLAAKMVCSSYEKTLIFSSRCCENNVMLQNSFVVKYLRSSDQIRQNRGDSAPLTLEYIIPNLGLNVPMLGY